jgi:hypothetical protein
MDHDQRFKVLLEEFFRELLELFWPRWAIRFDFNTLTWLKDEVFTDPPRGERLRVDLVARLKLMKPGARSKAARKDWLALVHAEVESRESVEQLRPRMYEYYRELRRKHGLPVLPLALLLRVGLNGLGVDQYEEHFEDFRPLLFQYLYIGMPGLDGQKYLAGDNSLGVALSPLMDLPESKRAELTAQALDRLVHSEENMWRKFLLCECVQAYAPLSSAQRKKLDTLLVSERYSEVKAMTKTWYEEGMEKGVEKGRQAGQMEILQDLLEQRFGTLTPKAKAKLEKLTTDQVRQLAKNILQARSLRELGL